MRQFQLLFLAGMMIIFISCQDHHTHVPVVESKSFPEGQVSFDTSISQRLLADSLQQFSENQQNDSLMEMELSSLNRLFERLKQSPSDSLWGELQTRWENFHNEAGANGQSDIAPGSLSNRVIKKWAELNADLLKFSGEAKFAEALEKMLYAKTQPALSKELLKSVIYTHIFDQIFIHIPVTSSVSFQHTTGGNVKLIQQYDPSKKEMILKCECSDTRFLDLFIRIPSDAVNPTVNHGNVKYVALPGEYCEISRKWKNGDEIRVLLKN
jgi:hypothetical protein